MTRLELTDSQDEAIRQHGVRAYAQECCGFLIGKATETVRGVVHVLPAVNDRGEEERHNRFTISPEAFLRAEKAARKEKLDLLGFYHSHPNAPARPSAYDLEHAWPWYSYVIVSVRDGVAREMTSWVLDDDRSKFHEQSIAVVPDPPASGSAPVSGEDGCQ